MKTSRDIQKLINAIDQGVGVYNGMLHHNRVRMYLKESLQIAEEIENRKSFSELDTLRSENTILTERVKELNEIDEKNKKQIELKDKRIQFLEKDRNHRDEVYHKNYNTLLRMDCEIDDLKAELAALKESKTITVRLCK